MPNLNISDDKSVETYANNTKAILIIKSTITGNIVRFPAFLTDFSQTFSSNWSTEDVYGRNDPIATFQSTRRTISVGFNVPAATQEGAKDNLNKCSNLIKMLYPGYSKSLSGFGNVISKSPLVKVKFANLIVSPISTADEGGDGLLGWIDNLSWNPVLDMGMFTMTGNFYPKVISLSFNFNVLHQTELGQDKDDNDSSPLGDWLGDQKGFPFGGF